MNIGKMCKADLQENQSSHYNVILVTKNNYDDQKLSEY